MHLTPYKTAPNLRKEAQRIGLSTITLQEGSDKIDPVNDFAENKNVGIITGKDSGIIVVCIPGTSFHGKMWNVIAREDANPKTKVKLSQKLKSLTVNIGLFTGMKMT